MPSFIRRRSDSPASSHSAGGTTLLPTGLAELKTVGFPEHLVTGTSRPLNNAEHWALYNFEMHARQCPSCFSAYTTHRAGEKLCPGGHALAQQVAQHLTSEANGTRAFAVRAASPASQSSDRVEIPSGYECTKSLFHAMERSVRHRRRQKPIVSLDGTYAVAPRVPSEHLQRRGSTRRDSFTAPLPRREPEIVDWPEYEVREPAEPVVPRSKTTASKSSSSSSKRRHSHLPSTSSSTKTTDARPATPLATPAIQVQTREATPPNSPERKHRRMSTATTTSSSKLSSSPPSSSAPSLTSRDKTERRRSAYAYVPTPTPAPASYDVEVREPTPVSATQSRRTSKRYSVAN